MKMLIGALVSGGVADILEKAGLSGIWPGVIEDAARILMVIIGFFIVKLIIKIILAP